MRLQSSPSKKRSHTWRPRLFILIPGVIAALMFPAPEHASINSGVVEPVQIPTVLQDLPTPAQADKPLDSQLSNNSVPSSESGLEVEPTTSVSPGAPAQPAASTQRSAQPTMANQGTMMSSQVTLPSHGDTPSRRSHRRREIAPVGSPGNEAQRSLAKPVR
jgi:hypothetical protein